MLVAATACTGGGEERPDPDRELREARARLAVLAQATANSAYDAQYRFVQQPSSTTGTIRIRQNPPQYRIDIVAKDGASFFALRTGVVSCSSKKAKRTCFLVARPGEPVPDIFDPGVQRLFRDAVEDLAANPGDYLVQRVPTATPTATLTPSASATASATATASPRPSASTLPIPSGECYRVERVDTTPDPEQPVGFENGTYCFAEQGVATSISVASGSLTLVKLLGPPPPGAFTPPAKVQRLPDLSPSPTATRSPTPSPTASPTASKK